MSRLVRLLSVVVCAVGACALAPAAALGASHHRGAGRSGVVLSTMHHAVRLVDRGHRVTDVGVGSTRGLHRGDVVSVRGGEAHVTGSVHRISFLGRVVRSSAHGTVLRLGDGSTFKLGRKPGRRGHGARAASTLTVDVQGLAPGQTILVTISTDDQGNVALTIKVVSAATDIGDGEPHAQGPITDDSDDGDEIDGTVTAIAGDLSSITVDPGDGEDLATIPVDDPSVLDGVSVGDDVAVITDGDGIAIEVDVFDSSEDPGAGDDGEDQ